MQGEPDLFVVLDKETYEEVFTAECEDLEHGNGMTYNSKTNEIIIAPYTCKTEDNRGSLFIVDADTFQLKRQVYVSDGSWDPSAIEYMDNTDQYIVQSNSNDNFTFYLYDSEFNYVGVLFEGDTSLEDNSFQDFCISGDFLISVPYLTSKNQSYLQIYSISEREYLGYYNINLNGLSSYEVESIAISDAGEIVLSVVLSGTNRMALYNTYVPIIYTVLTSAENGKITPSNGEVDIGSDYKVEYSCKKTYELKKLKIDGKDVDVEEYPLSYTFGNIQDDHSVRAKFTKIPKFKISTSVYNGTIDDSKKIQRDQDFTVHYEPDEHYEIDKILIDGKKVENPEIFDDTYTFDNIQKKHSIDVLFKEIPSYEISTEVNHGYITPTDDKVYRDENFTVNYKPDKGYQIAFMRVDGQWLSRIGADHSANQYTFDNIQSGHSIEVYYERQNFPYLILAGAFVICLPLGGIYLAISSIRRNKTNRNQGADRSVRGTDEIID